MGHGEVVRRSIVEGSLEAKLPTIWRDELAGQLGRSSEMEKVRREKMQVREKVGKSRNTVFFQCFVAPDGRKRRQLRTTFGRCDVEKVHAVVARSTF